MITSATISSTLQALTASMCFLVGTVSLIADNSFDYQYDFSERGIKTTAISRTPSEATGYLYEITSTGSWQHWGGSAHSALLSANKTYSFVARKLSDGDTDLATGQSITDFSFTVDSSWAWGSQGNNLITYLGLFNDDGNGYLAAVSTNGSMSFYALNTNQLGSLGSLAALKSGTTAYDSSKLALVSGGQWGNMKQNLTFSLVGSTLTLASSIDSTATFTYSLGPSESAYTDFTTIVIGGRQYNNEKIQIDSYSINGTVIPELSTSVIWIGIVLGLFVIVNRSALRKTLLQA